MKHKLYNRLLSLALALGLVVGMLPGMTFAGAVDSDATALQSQVEQIAEPTAEPETVSEESSQAEATPTPAPESSEEESSAESSQVEETPAPSEEPVQEPEKNEDTESLQPAVNFTNAGPLVMPPVTIGLAGATASMFRAPANNAIGNTDNSTDNELITNENVETTKKVTSIGTDENPKYQIKLEAYTKGTVSGGSVSVPADIVLVLDESGSMEDPISGGPVYADDLDTSENYVIYSGYTEREVRYRNGQWQYWGGWNWHTVTPKTGPDDYNNSHVQFYTPSVSREEAIVDAVNNFLDSMAADNPNLPETVTDHRVGMIGFSGENSARVIRPLGTNLNHISENTLNTSGGTYINYGLQLVDDVFNNGAQAVEGEERNRVVIIFTDGSPGSGNGYTSDDSHAAQAVNTANTIKKSVEAGGCGATVFTVGIFDGADPSDTNSWPNKYMNGMSSNYPNATGEEGEEHWFGYWDPEPSINLGTRVEDGDYYLSASNTEALNEIFEKISDSTTSPSVPLGGNAQVIDEVTQYFDLPADGAQVTLQVADYLGKDDYGNDLWGQPKDARESGVTADIEGQKVIVTGFDFDSNYITEEAKPDTENDHGRKLIITFTITPDEKFWGGNQVPTNVTETSGVANSEGTMVENFPVPDPVDVPLKPITLTGKDVNVYYNGETPNAADLVNQIEFPDDWRTDYVNNITYTTNGEVSNTEDKEYTVTATLSSKNPGTYGNKTATPTANVHIYKPEITWKDTTKDAGTNLTTLNLGTTDENFVSKVWKHGDTVANNMFGAEPTLTYTFTNESDGSLSTSLATDEHVKVGVAINGTSVGTDVVTFDWAENPESSGCTACTKPDSYQFRIHVGNGDLTIIKQISGGAGSYDNAVFDFKIEAENGMVYYIHLDASSGEAQDTINLPSGTYTVTELDNLNYKLAKIEGGKDNNIPEGSHGGSTEVTVGGGETTVTFTNNADPTDIPSDSGATQNNPSWGNGNVITWHKNENDDGNGTRPEDEQPTPEN